MEREADEDYAAGHYTTYDDAEAFLAGLDAAAKDHPEPRRRRSGSSPNARSGLRAPRNQHGPAAE